MTKAKVKTRRGLLSILLLVQLAVMSYSAFNDGNSIGTEKHLLDKAQSLTGTWQLWNMFLSHPPYQRWAPAFHLSDGLVDTSGFPEGLRETLVSFYLASDSDYGKALFDAFVKSKCSGHKGLAPTTRIDFGVESTEISGGKREKKIVHSARCG